MVSKNSIDQKIRFPVRLTISNLLLGLGLIITIGFITIAIFAPTWETWGWLQSPTESLSNPIHQPPNGEYWFGTTRQGYDVFSRTIFGSRAALQVVVVATSISLVIGVPLGLISGYLGGRIDRALLFLMDTIYTLPGLLLSVTLAFVVGRGVFNAAIAVSISYIPQYYRVVRNHTTSVKTELFIEAARAMGATPTRVLSRYLFFNVIQSVPVLFTLNAADAILILGGLGFLGLGLPETVPEWGYALRLALDALPTGIWWTAFFPGLAMTLMVSGLSLLGEGLSEVFNPNDQ
ncbi:ABC transporter permease [Dactylococcopsis salina]|uniref:ABC-type dipeptide/oligopeptide/nickel transport system, permease component n=1 Tax=Dactylococcopsis salina (strain PCC 8305) TaxID=13035 RepID=K9YTA3_DACS8|nr:ABC transporter permease [Dactylococcopsis salina]AFZ49702.1 ABC-type dipeptide/oligopeptide/nickel transport system, permease component [Dactylococcopsis salina PCC 8305]